MAETGKSSRSVALLVVAALAGAAMYHFRHRLNFSLAPATRVLGAAENCGRIIRGSSEKPDRAESRTAVACLLRNFQSCSPAKVKIVNKWDDSNEVDHFEARIQVLESREGTCWVESRERSNVKDRNEEAITQHCRRLEIPAVGSTTAGEGADSNEPEDIVAADCPAEN